MNDGPDGATCPDDIPAGWTWNVGDGGQPYLYRVATGSETVQPGDIIVRPLPETAP